MRTWASTLAIDTDGRGTIEITNRVRGEVERSGIVQGLCNLFILHTSASLIITENADPEVQRDLERFLARLVPDADPLFRHVDEGPDDMPAHVRNVLTETSINLPVIGSTLGLGTWQGIFLWEHRASPHQRRVVVTLQGEET